MKMMNIQKSCRMCGEVHTIKVSEEAHENWIHGMYIQDAMPELTEDERELMISGICGKCFDELFSEEEE